MVNEAEEESDAEMADPFTVEVTLSTLKSSDAVTPPLIDTSDDAPMDITLSSDSLEAGSTVMEVSVKVPALTEKRGQLSADAEVSVKVIVENVTSLSAVDAMNAPDEVPERDWVSLVTVSDPITEKLSMEGRVSDALSDM